MAITWERHKDPDEVVDYQGDWSDDMSEMGDDTINSSVWILEVDATLVNDDDDFSDTTTTIWVSGGTTGTTYSLVNRITTTGGRTLDQTFKLKVKPR